MTAALPLQSLVAEWTWVTVVQVIGYGVFATAGAVAVAFCYRWRTARPVNLGVAVLTALGLVATGVTLEAALSSSILPGTDLQDERTGIYLLAAFSVGAIGSEAGRRIGDHAARDVFEIEAVDATGEVATLVRSGGIAVELTLPDVVEDAEGYEPVEQRTKRQLEGRTFRFPRRLSSDELRHRVAARIEQDYDVDHVDVELGASGTVDFLALGRRSTGLGPTLPEGTVAIAVRGDPAPDANTGDPVELWTVEDGESRLAATGVLRATVGDVTTVAVDADDVGALASEGPYRILTRHGRPDDRNQLVSVIRSAEETVTKVTVEPDGHLEGEFVGWLPTTVLAIARSGTTHPLPADNETLRGGDAVYVLGTPAELRSLASFERERKDERAPPADRSEPGATDRSASTTEGESGGDSTEEEAEESAADASAPEATPSGSTD